MRFVQASDDPEKYRPKHWKNWRIPQGKENHPVVWVSLHDALAYCAWLSGITGEAITLPSEAEWEKAARGPKGWVWPWGDQFDERRCNTKESGIGDTTPVDQYNSGMSHHKVWDMSGNVWELTRDIVMEKYPYIVDDGREKVISKEDIVCMLRGGSWCFYRGYARAAFRGYNDLNARNYNLGFRLCRDSPPSLHGAL